MYDKKEEWVDIIGYEGIYKIDNSGNILSVKRNALLAKKRHPKGYDYTALSKDSVRTGFKIHRLVAQHFIPNPKNKPQVNHKNGIRNDNRVENLEWCTNSENYAHSIEYLGRVDKLRVAARGASNPNAKLDLVAVSIIREAVKTFNVKKIAAYFRVSDVQIYNIKLHRSWT